MGSLPSIKSMAITAAVSIAAIYLIKTYFPTTAAKLKV